MNPQPPPEVGTFVALLVACMVAFYAIKAHIETSSGLINKVNYDMFELGHIEEPSPPVVIVNTPKVTTKVKVNKTKKFESTQLYQDCIDTLIAIGYKKTEAKKRAKAVFIRHNPKTVQSFLNIVLQAP